MKTARLKVSRAQVWAEIKKPTARLVVVLPAAKLEVVTHA